MANGIGWRVTSSPGISLHGQHRINGSVLFDADLSLPGGMWTCLLGKSGVGKSTILRLILGLQTGGNFHGTIAATDRVPLDGRISYMAQSDLLLPWLTVLQNTVIGAKLRGEVADTVRAKELLHRVGLTDHIDKTPTALSGGMRQRAALARTLMEDRPVVFLDEPFSALDASTRADMQELATEVLVGKTILLVTHDPSEAARIGDQILVMSPEGVQHWPAPGNTIPRDLNEPSVIDCQTRLLEHLRGHQA